ncbi:MAG: DUF1566 domain-containing protein [Desulfobacteraceae bacterium]|nr:DUF1566 domain-containing protein [Desulfobacteraceae bacterium]
MKKSLFILVVLGIVSLVVTQSFATRALKVVADFDHKKGKIGTYRALVIGIQNYQDPKIPDLKTSLNDAKAVADILQDKYGFEVESLLDGSATRQIMYSKLRDLALKTKEEDSVLIYYAGHGDLDRQYDDGWWIPVDAEGGKPATYLDNIQIQKAMRNMKARHVLLISDSCYSGSLFGQARSMPSVINDKYYLNLYNEKSRWGLTSGNKTPVSDSGTGGNSIFAYQLIKKLRNNDKSFITTQEIYTDIAPIIANNSEQTPLCRPIRGTGDQGGEFVFVTAALKPIEQTVQENIANDDFGNNRQEISQERRSIERQKREIEIEKLKQERQKLALEKQKFDLERQKLEADKKKQFEELSTNNQYSKDNNGIVFDKKTRLEWFAGPNKNMAFSKARKWIKDLDINNRDWRLPTKKELQSIYKKGEGRSNCTPLLIDSDPWIVYTRDVHVENIYDVFYFANGLGTYARNPFHKVIAVRTRKL